MYSDWHIKEYLRQLDDTMFYRLLDNDIATDLQKRILKYTTERMNRDKITNHETKSYFGKSDLKPGSDTLPSRANSRIL